MHWINVGLIVMAFLDGALALVVFYRNPKNKIAVSFALSVLFVGLWTLSIAMFREADSNNVALLWTYFENGFGGLVVIPFYFFSLFFPYSHRKLTLKNYFLISASLVLLAYLIFIPGAWVINIVLRPHDNDYVLNRLGAIIFALYFYIYLFLIFKNLIIKFYKSDGVHRRALKKIILGTGIFGFFGSAFGALFPAILGNDGPLWAGPFFSLVLILYITHFLFFEK